MKDTFFRHFGKSSLDPRVFPKESKAERFRGFRLALDTSESRVSRNLVWFSLPYLVSSLLFPALSRPPSSMPLSWRSESHSNCGGSFCGDCHQLLACFVLLSSLKERTTVQFYCWNLCLFAFKELGSAVIFSLLNLLFGLHGG